MTGDNLRDIVVTIRSITSTTSSGNTTLMSTPEFAFIDSAVPELWLPVEVCQQFEKAFGLTLDSASGLYLINDTTHQNLLNINPNITFTLANQKTGGTTIDIVLPYASFDLNVTSPVLVNKTSFYFPIKSTDDDTLYTLGRTFLQEAYVTTHYESRTFNVSQCIFDESASPHVIALPSSLPTSTSGGNSTSGSGTGSSSGSGSKHKKLSGGAIAGIVIGALAALILLAALIFFCLRRRRRQEQVPPGSPVHEIDAGKRIEPVPPGSAQASAFASEVDGQEKVEIQGNPIMHPQELEAEVPVVGEGSGGMGAADGGAMSPIKEQKTPMAELGAEEGGLGEAAGTAAGYGERGQGSGDGHGERGLHEDDIVSPNSDTNPSMMARGRPLTGSGSGGSPTVSEATWTPSTPVQRRGSRFEESFD